MQLIMQIKVIPDNPQELKLLMIRFNNVCNYLSEIAFNERIFNWLALQRRMYYEIRDKFGLRAGETKRAIRKVAYAYNKNKNKREHIAEFKLNGSIPLYGHIYYKDNTVMIYGLKAKIITPKDIILPKYPKEGYLSYINGKFIINQTIEVESQELYKTTNYLGCDLGIVNILTDSDGVIYSGNKLNGLRKRNFKLRQKLDKKHSRSARRLLNKRRRKERLFARDINHQISKKVVEKAYSASLGIALENLTGIVGSIRVRRADRRQHNSWGFNQLRQFIEYKAELKGVPVVKVDARNTSRTCPICGYVDKKNRKTQSEFKCIECGFGQHADTIAAINISRRAVGNQPYAPSEDEVQV